MKEFACGDVVPGCGKRFRAESEQQILEQVAAHARDDHGLHQVPDEVVKAVIDNIKTVG